jgi:FAD/FMN-containing dehydrogenase
VEVMRRVKQALDPQGILNPGKLIPSPNTERS